MPRVVVLEIHHSKFYLHEFPFDVVGTLNSQTGSFTFTGSLLNLNPDTSMSISLNTLGLVSMSINCAPMRTIEMISAKKLIVTYKHTELSDGLMNEQTYDLALSFTPDLNTTIKPFGITLVWIKKYFNLRPSEGIRICIK